MNNSDYANKPGYNGVGHLIVSLSMDGNVFASGVLVDGNAFVQPLAGCPIPACVSVYPAAGDTITVRWSCNGGSKWFTKITTTVDWYDFLDAGITHLEFKRNSGTGTTSTWSIC